MAARSLKHYTYAQVASGTWQAVGTAPAAGRALVGKVIVTVNAAATINLAVSAGVPVAADLIAASIVLNLGEVYTETGVVILAGEQVRIFAGVANAVNVTVIGEEVDN